MKGASVPSYLLQSLAVYGFVALVSLLFGSTLLRLLRPELPRSLRFCLAPVTTATVWAWLLALGIRLGHTIRGTSIIVWTITLLVVAAGILWRVWAKWPARWLVVSCVLMPMVAIAPAFWYGLDSYSNYLPCDSLGYCGLARHAWQYHFREDYADLKPVYMASLPFRSLRATGPALIGFFSRLYVPGETQMAANVALLHSLLMLAGATAALLRSLRLRPWAIVTGVLLLGSSRWLGNVIFMGSWDQLLTLAYLPACLVLAASRKVWSWRMAVLLGAFLGTAALAYPEGSAFVFLPTGASLGWRLLTSLRNYRRHLRFAGLMLLSCFLFLHAEMGVVVDNLRVQVTKAMRSDEEELRPGGTILSGMLGQAPVAAFFGMGPEWGSRWRSVQSPAWVVALQQASALVLTGTVLAGLLLLLARGRVDLPFAVGVLLSGALYFLLRHRYPYGACKLVTFAWPLVVAVVVLVAVAALRFHLRSLGIGLAACITLAFSWCISPLWVAQASIPGSLASRPFREYHELQQAVRRITNGAPLLLASQNVVISSWLEFFLRDEPIANACATSRFVDLAPGASRPQPDQAKFLITDGCSEPVSTSPGCWQLIYSTDSFYLWKRYSAEEVAALHERCLQYPVVEWGRGFFPEEVSGKDRWRWCGSQGEMVITNRAGTPKLVALEWHVHTYAAGTATLTLRSPFLNLDLPVSPEATKVSKIIKVPPGRQVIHWGCTATPCVHPTRTIVFAVHDFRIKKLDTSDLLAWGAGFYAEEQQGGARWRWCGSQGDLEIRNPTNHPLSLVLQFMAATHVSGPVPLILKSCDLSERFLITGTGAIITKNIEVPPGGRLIHFECPAEPFLEPARTLVFTVHNYTLREIF
jgi:hypothetical protein